jgi:hypothetical protein
MTAPPVVSRRASSAHRKRKFWSVAMNASFVIAALLTLLLLPEARVFLAPAFALCGVTLWFLTTLWAREGSPPVFESGTLWMLTTAIYGTIPLIGFALMHGQWTRYVDSRLTIYDFNAAELGSFGWNYVIYAVSFLIIYMPARGRVALDTRPLRRPSAAGIWAMIVVLLVIEVVTIALRVVYGYDMEAGYTNLAEAMERAQRVPYVILQFAHIFLSAKLVVQQAILAMLLMKWRRLPYRLAIVIWLVVEILTLLMRLGSRSPVVLLLLSGGLLYHRLVRPVSFRVFVAAGLILLGAFIGAGALRTIQFVPEAATENMLTATNEFQALFTTAYDIQKRKELGMLSHVPWQLYAVDFYLLIPRQLLPFQKIDPAQWYVEEIGAAGSGVGFMFGVMAEAVLGFGRIELIARGAILGLLLGLLHRWYVKHASGYWTTLLYLFVSIFTYYTFRATTFWFLYFVVYEFLPVVGIVKLIEYLLSRVWNQSWSRARAT